LVGYRSGSRVAVRLICGKQSRLRRGTLASPAGSSRKGALSKPRTIPRSQPAESRHSDLIRGRLTSGLGLIRKTRREQARSHRQGLPRRDARSRRRDRQRDHCPLQDRPSLSRLDDGATRGNPRAARRGLRSHSGPIEVERKPVDAHVVVKVRADAGALEELSSLAASAPAGGERRRRFESCTAHLICRVLWRAVIREAVLSTLLRAMRAFSSIEEKTGVDDNDFAISYPTHRSRLIAPLSSCAFTRV
jgi:hypothetical protein